MPRVAFRLRIKPGKEEEYDRAHRHVWPELITRLKQVGISGYSIFRRDQDLFLVMEVEDFEATCQTLGEGPINLKWQETMAPLFDSVPGLKPGEKFATMTEVFHLK
jgi:L-rhamnose mutarotase